MDYWKSAGEKLNEARTVILEMTLRDFVDGRKSRLKKAKQH